MKTPAKVVTAADINEAHRAARSSAESAVASAIRCGQLLIDKKGQLEHGDFRAWVASSTDVPYSTATLYMKAAKQKANALAFSSLRELFPSGKKPEPRTFPKSEPPQDAGPAFEQPAAPDPEPEPEVLRPDWEPDEDAQFELAEKDYVARVDAAMAADDKLAEALAQIKQQSSLIATLTASRDGYLAGKNEVVRLLKKEQRRVEQLRQQLRDAEGEIAKLRERVALQAA